MMKLIKKLRRYHYDIRISWGRCRMSSSFMKLEAKDTHQVRRYTDEDGNAFEEVYIHEECMKCHDHPVDLYGHETSGHFNGYCLDCLKKVFALHTD